MDGVLCANRELEAINDNLALRGAEKDRIIAEREQHICELEAAHLASQTTLAEAQEQLADTHTHTHTNTHTTPTHTHTYTHTHTHTHKQ